MRARSSPNGPLVKVAIHAVEVHESRCIHYLDRDGDISRKDIRVDGCPQAFGDLPLDFSERGRFDEPVAHFVPFIRITADFSAEWAAITGVATTRIEGSGATRRSVPHLREKSVTGRVRRDRVQILRCVSTQISDEDRAFCERHVPDEVPLRALDQLDSKDVQREAPTYEALSDVDERRLRAETLTAIAERHIAADSCRNLTAEIELGTPVATIIYAPFWIQQGRYEDRSCRLIVSALDGTIGGTAPDLDLLGAQLPNNPSMANQRARVVPWLAVIGVAMALLVIAVVLSRT